MVPLRVPRTSIPGSYFQAPSTYSSPDSYRDVILVIRTSSLVLRSSYFLTRSYSYFQSGALPLPSPWFLNSITTPLIRHSSFVIRNSLFNSGTSPSSFPPRRAGVIRNFQFPFGSLLPIRSIPLVPRTSLLVLPHQVILILPIRSTPSSLTLVPKFNHHAPYSSFVTRHSSLPKVSSLRKDLRLHVFFFFPGKFG